MKCPRCGNAAPAGAGFCMHCGSALAKAPAPSQVPTHAPVGMPGSLAATSMPLAGAFEAQRRKSRILAAVATVLALVVIVAGLQTSGFLRKFGSSGQSDGLAKSGAGGPNSLQKLGSGPAPSLQKLGNAGPSSLDKTATRITMPDDIRDWLEHLHQTEIERVNITNQNLAQARVEQAKDNVSGGLSGVESALNGVDDPNSELKSPVEGLARMIKQMHDQTYDLLKKFDAYPAPTECVPIQAAYDQAVGEEASLLGDLGDHLAAGDVAKLQSMAGVSMEGVDYAGAKTDRLVGEICDKYQTKKWFTINKDIGAGGVLASPGF